MRAWPAVTMAAVLVCAACQTEGSPSAVPTPTAQVLDVVTPLPPTPTRGMESSRLPSPTGTGVPRLGYLDFPSESGDAGNVVVLAGSTIEITWTDAPPGAERYEFFLTPENGFSSLLGTDDDPSNGVSIQWIVPEHLSATLEAFAYFADGSSITTLPSFYIYSGEAPPADVCTLRSTTIGVVDIYNEPYPQSGSFAYIAPGTYHTVLARSDDGWYKVDVQGAFHLDSGKVASGTGWVSPRHPYGLSGPCQAVPTVPVTPSANPFPTFTPGG